MDQVLTPPKDLATLLRRDYGRMSEMFFAEPPQFDEILGELRDLEEEVNRLVSP
jgi:hypothetical protein